MSLITIERKVLEKNDLIALENRKLFEHKKIFVINLISSPGSGKTSLIEKTISGLKGKHRIGVIEGDIQTDLDAQRIDSLGIPVVQIVTNGACHLDSMLVRDAFKRFDSVDLDILIIENVGNLVCPAGYDLGENMKIVISATTEGEDKPLKYPTIFRNSQAMIINKIDLLPYLSNQNLQFNNLLYNIEKLRNNSISINPDIKIFETSCMSGEGIKDWCDWLSSCTQFNP
jgi:hydrogenase nickel incorporation protein HypB